MPFLPYQFLLFVSLCFLPLLPLHIQGHLIKFINPYVSMHFQGLFLSNQQTAAKWPRHHPFWWVSSFYTQSLVKNRQMATDTCLARRWQFFTMAFISCVGSSVCLSRLLNCQNRNHKLFQQYSVQNNELPLVTEAFGYHRNKYLPKQEQRFILFPKQQQEALAFGYPGYPFGI